MDGCFSVTVKRNRDFTGVDTLTLDIFLKLWRQFTVMVMTVVPVAHCQFRPAVGVQQRQTLCLRGKVVQRLVQPRRQSGARPNYQICILDNRRLRKRERSVESEDASRCLLAGIAFKEPPVQKNQG
mgnify:CR=1 FL=1